MFEDKLKEVSPDKIDDILQDLKQNWPTSIHIYHFIWMCRKWGNVVKSMKNLNVYQYVGQNGEKLYVATNSAIIFDGLPLQRVMIHPLMNDNEKLKKLLLETDAIDWTNNHFFEGVFEKYIPVIQDVCKIKNKSCFVEGLCYKVWLPLEKQQSIKLNIPPGMYIEELTEKHVARVNETWKYKCSGSEEYVADTILHYKGIGLFRKEDNKLVAWNTAQNFGALGMLYTEDDERGKGYGTVVTAALAKFLINVGIVPFACIKIDNSSSMALYTKLGFDISERVSWIPTLNLYEKFDMSQN